MARALVRQWLLLTMLPKPPRRIDTATIEERLREHGIEVHRRTIQRDLLELATVFPIVADERAKPFGWRWADTENTLEVREPMMLIETVKLRARKALLAELNGRMISEDEKHAIVRHSFESMSRLVAFVTEHAGDVEVLEPPTLRAEITRRARKVLELHTQ